MEITQTLDIAWLLHDGSTLLLYLLSGYLNNKNLFDNIEIVESGFRRDALGNILRTNFLVIFISIPTAFCCRVAKVIEKSPCFDKIFKLFLLLLEKLQSVRHFLFFGNSTL